MYAVRQARVAAPRASPQSWPRPVFRRGGLLSSVAPQPVLRARAIPLPAAPDIVPLSDNDADEDRNFPGYRADIAIALSQSLLEAGLNVSVPELDKPLLLPRVSELAPAVTPAAANNTPTATIQAPVQLTPHLLPSQLSRLLIERRMEGIAKVNCHHPTGELCWGTQVPVDGFGPLEQSLGYSVRGRILPLQEAEITEGDQLGHHTPGRGQHLARQLHQHWPHHQCCPPPHHTSQLVTGKHPGGCQCH